MRHITPGGAHVPGPLDGITVLDFTRYQNGPHATVMLSDMGATIIKVEMPAVGDPGRSLGVGADGFCSYFEALNRGKRSVTLNLYNPGFARNHPQACRTC